MKSLQGWKRPFDDPIPLPRGSALVTLEEAANYIQKLPKAEQLLEKQLDDWRRNQEDFRRMVELGLKGKK
jgi:hypothetical protein